MFASKDVSIGQRAAYPIARSVRFRSSATASLSRTFSTTGTSRQIFTLSVWVKRGTLGAIQQIMGCYDGSVGAATGLYFTASDTLNFDYGGTVQYQILTTQVFRDPSSWYHIVVACDSTQATAANRVKIYVNGSQVTAFSTANYPAQNANGQWMINTANNKIGTQWNSASNWLDGYLAEMNFVDGQQLAPTAFGAFNIYGVWQPAKYQGTYGTNGFYLNFKSFGTAAALGTDSSGNSNTWTVTNISVTAGATYDAMQDTPTLTSLDAANYATLNPIAGAPTTTIAFSNANLTVTISPQAGGTPGAYGTMGMSSGKWYWEVQWVSGGNALYDGIGIANFINPANYRSGPTYFLYLGNPFLRFNTGGGDTNSAYGAAWTAGDIIGVAFDSNAGTLTFYKNGTSQGVAATGITASTWYPLIVQETNANTNVFTANFGQRPFTYTPPTGFNALNTYSLSAPSIPNGATYMAASLYTGTGATQSIVNTVNGVSFQPDWVWLKQRSASTYDHNLYDSVRGVNKALFSNTSAAEVTYTDRLMSFDSGGFGLGVGAATNASTVTYVAWQWKANGTGVTNTSGSITSTVSANTTAGFSIVTYTGTGATATVGHGLSVAPSMLIVKPRSIAGSWTVWQSALAGTDYLVLNATDAKATLASVWNSTVPTSSVFSLGTAGGANTNGATYVAYVFAAVAGYSAFGSYTGNGSTDGPFVYLGFRPRYILIKRTDAIGNWNDLDTSRSAYNGMINLLLPNTSDAESAGGVILDSVANGFKLRDASGNWNASAGTYIYAAFAENPFKYSLAR